MSDFIIQNVPTAAVTSLARSSLTNAAGNLTLANGTNTTEFDQTSNVVWKWYNTTVATNSTTNASPVIDLSANYWTGAASAEDKWTITSSLAAGTNGASTLTFAHSGSTGQPAVSFPNVLIGNGTNTLPSLVFASNTSLGFYKWSTHHIGVEANFLGFFPEGVAVPSFYLTESTTIAEVRGNAGFRLTWAAQHNDGDATWPADLGFTKLAAGSLAIGNGSANDTTANLSFGKVIKYNGVATVSAGVPAEYATSDLTAQSAAITATTLYATTATGMYRVSWSSDITTAATASSSLGGTNGFQVLYTSPTDSVVKTTVAGNSVTSAANTTGTAVGGSLICYAKTGTNIQFTYDYTSVGVTAMVYELHVKLEAL
jgi:hypothetical protein